MLLPTLENTQILCSPRSVKQACCTRNEHDQQQKPKSIMFTKNILCQRTSQKAVIIYSGKHSDTVVFN